MYKAILAVAFMAFTSVGVFAQEVDSQVVQSFRAKFDNLTPANDVGWMVAQPLKPLGAPAPPDLAVAKKDGKIAFRKTAFGTLCQICPKIPLRPGIKIAITFSPMLESDASYAPLPYFGVRGAKGQEKVLQHLQNFPPEPSKQYKIYLEASQTGVTCLYTCPARNLTSLKSFSPREFGRNGLPNPVLVYFHMNDVSGLVIHDIRTNQAQMSPITSK